MPASHKQKQDLLRFGGEIRRLAARRLITARNAGRITTEQMDSLAELLPTAEEVTMLLDEFRPQVDVVSALAELEPLVPVLQRAQLNTEGNCIVLRGARNRVLTAIRYLKADPR
jgi:hypothetical protein